MSWQNDPVAPAGNAPWANDPVVAPSPRDVLGVAAKVNPDQAAEAARLAKRYPAQPDVLLRNLGDAKLQAAVDDADAKLNTNVPALRARMTDIPFAQQAHDDVNTLADIEGFIRQTGRSTKSGVFGASRGAAGVFQAGAEFVAPVLDFLEADPFKDPNDWRVAIGGNPLRRLAEGFASIGQQNLAVQQSLRPQGKQGVVGSGFFSGVESLTQNLLALPMAFANPAAALTMMTATTGGNSYQDAREKGLGMTQALPYAASQASIEYFTEKLPLTRLLGDVKAGTPFLQTLMRQVALEIPGEQVATILQDLNEWAVLNPDKPFTSYLEERPSAAAQTLVATIVGAGGNVTVAKGLEKVMTLAAERDLRAAKSDADLQNFERLLGAAADSKLRERAPETFAQFVQDAATEAGAPTAVYVDARALTDALNQAGITDEQLAELMPSVPAQIADAFEAGGVVEIPVGEALAAAPGTPIEQVLLQNARLEPDGLSRVEVDEANKQAAEFVQTEVERVMAQAEQRAAAEQEAGRIKTQIAEQLNATGRFRPEVNDAYATMVGAFYATTAQRLGVTPSELYARYPLRVAGEMQTGESLEQGDVTADVDAAIDEDGGLGEYGLRVIPRGQTVAAGDELDPSYRWIDGEQTDEELNGTSTIGVKQGNVAAALRDLKANGYSGDQIVLVVGDRAESGEDPGERVIRNARVLRVWPRTLVYDSANGRGNLTQEETGRPVAGDLAEKPSPSGLRHDAVGAGVGGSSPDVALAQQTRATFSPSQMLIALGPNADYSSFLHETGHFWLEVLSDIATQPGAPEQVGKDWATVTDWFGVTPEQWAGMTLDQKRPYHERWAESVEQYFFEGKAPSVELRGVFDRFRTWLMTVYRSLKQFLAMRASTPGGQAGAGQLAQSQQVDEMTGLPLNADGTVTVYHHTSAANADAIRKTGRLKSAAEPDVYVTTRRETDTGYGDTAVPIRVNPELLQLDDEFPDGRMDFRIDTGKPGGSVRVQVGAGTLAQSPRGNPAFDKWFKNSKVVDAEGNPLVVYHGTLADVTAFDPEKIGSNFSADERGFFFTSSPKEASDYASSWTMPGGNNLEANSGANVIPAYVSLQKPLIVNPAFLAKEGMGGLLGPGGSEDTISFWDNYQSVILEWADERRADGVIVEDPSFTEANGEPRRMVVAFKPTQIKSATGNRGTYDPYNRNILKQGDTAGPLNLTDEVRQVMDRLLATDEQITEMERVREYGLLFKSPEEAGMTPEQWAAYTSADEKAHAEALTELSKRNLRDMGIVMRKRMRALRDVQRDMAEKRKAVEQEAAAQIAAEPVYRAMRWLKKGEMTTPDGEDIKATDGFKLDAEAVAAIFPESMPGRPDLTKLRGMTLKKGGLSPDIVADMFGFRDGAHLITSITEAFPQQDQVDGLTDQMMLERYGDLATARGQERAADEAVHNENRARVLAAEMAAVSQANNARAPVEVKAPPPAKGMVRYYHGGNPESVTGALWFTSDLRDAEGWASRSSDMQVWYVDVPENDPVRGGEPEFGVLPPSRMELPPEFANKRKPLVRKAGAAGGRTVNAMVQAAKQFAERLVEGKKLKDLKPQQHTAAETRAARAAEKALAKGDTQAVIVAKRDQLLNFHAAKATNEARTEALKTLAWFKKIATLKDDTAGKSRDLDVVKAMQSILGAYGIGEKRAKTAAEYMDLVRQNDPTMFAALEPSIVAATAAAKPVEQLTVAELRALNEELQAMWFLAKRSRQMEVDGNLLDLEDAAEEVKARMQEIGIPDSMPGDASAITPAEQRALKLKGFLAAARRVESWAQAKDGAGRGPFRRLVWEPVREAADRYRVAKGQQLKAFRDLLKPIESTLTKRKIVAPELGYTFGEDTDGVALAEILHALLHTGNESNKRKLLLGRKWATENADGTLDTSRWDAFIQRMVDEGVLQPAHFDFAQGVWDLMESMKPLAQKTHREVFGRYFNEVTANEFTDPWGRTLRGGYVPAQADARIVSDQATKRLMEDENASMQFAFPTTAKGFTKGRVEYNRPLLLDLRSLTQHIDKVLLFSHMESPVRDVRKLLTQKGVAYGLNRLDPVAFDSILTPWLNRAAKQQVETPVAGDAGLMRFFSALRRRAGMAAMFANVANAAQQLAGFSMAAVRVKPSKLAAATAQYMAAPRATAEMVATKSDYMQTRMANEVMNMTDAINDILLDPSTYEKTKAFLTKHSYFLQSAVDNVMGPIIWTGAYNQALEQGMEDREAVRYADSAVRETQGSTAPEDVSRIETGNAFVRLFTQFAGYFNMQANLLGTELNTVVRDLGLRKGLGRGLYVLLFGYLVNAWVAEAIMQLFKGGPDDEDKDGEYWDNWLAQVFGWSLVRGTTAMVPVVGPAANALINTTNSKPYDDRISTSPAISMIESAVKVPSDVYKIVEGKDVKPSTVIRDVATLTSMVTGIPANAFAKPIGYLADVDAGKVSPTSAADAARGTVTGVASPESKR